MLIADADSQVQEHTVTEGTFVAAGILIVDDQVANIRLLEGILRRAGYTWLSSTTDPREALSIFSRLQPDLVLLDLMMPHINGFEVMEQLKPLIPSGDYLPILVLTADATSEVKRRALSAGAKDFLSKPFDTIEVLLRIDNLLKTRLLHLQLREQNHVLDEMIVLAHKMISRINTFVLGNLSAYILRTFVHRATLGSESPFC